MARTKKDQEQEVNTTPQYEHKVKVAKEKEDIAKRHAVKEEYYIQNGNKICRELVKANGNKVRMFAFMATSNPELVKKLKETGQLR